MEFKIKKHRVTPTARKVHLADSVETMIRDIARWTKQPVSDAIVNTISEKWLELNKKHND